MFVFRGFPERKMSQTQITLQEIKTVQKKEKLELPAEWARTRWPDSEDMPWISADGQSIAAHDMPAMTLSNARNTTLVHAHRATQSYVNVFVYMKYMNLRDLYIYT